MSRNDVFAKPKIITDMLDCYFYHEMDIPGYGHVTGEWDLRGREREYLGGVNVAGKRVLDVGTASGYLSFYMEKQGADVIAYDISEDQTWDIVPFHGYNYQETFLSRKAHVKKINNAFWFAHGAFKSRVKMVYGTVYEIPKEIGPVDISVFGCVLLHVRDPFLALQRALSLTKETVVVTEQGASRLGEPCMRFLPSFKTCEPKETWWELPPAIIQNFLAVLGFEENKVIEHSQKNRGPRTGETCKWRHMYTVLGHRTKDFRDVV